MSNAAPQAVALAPCGGAIFEEWEEDDERVPVPLNQHGVAPSTWRLHRKRHKLRSEAKFRLLRNDAESEEWVWDELARRLLKVEEDARRNTFFAVKVTEVGMEAAPTTRAELHAAADCAAAQFSTGAIVLMGMTLYFLRNVLLGASQCVTHTETFLRARYR
eukprot:6994909-Prymnesium_polylepis.1